MILNTAGVSLNTKRVKKQENDKILCDAKTFRTWIRSDIQIGESEVESKEKEIPRSHPFPEKPPSPFSPCDKYSQETLLSLKIELPTSSIVNKSFQKLLKYLFVKVRY